MAESSPERYSRKLCGKGRNCSSGTSSPFPTEFSTDLSCHSDKQLPVISHADKLTKSKSLSLFFFLL